MYGVDLADLFRKKRWVHLLALIDGLPQHSRYLSAFLNDEEEAEKIVNHPEFDPTAKPSPPPLAGYSQINYQLANIEDLLQAVIGTTVSVNGGKARQIKPALRPVTAIEKAKKERSQRNLQKMQKMFFKDIE